MIGVSAPKGVGMAKPALSVVIPAYNAAAYLGRALDSVLVQSTDLRCEFIVVDDGSTDVTGAVARSRTGVVHITKPNGGPASARNLGVKTAAADLILFLDADDLALPGRFACQGRYMLANPETAVCFGNWNVEDGRDDYLAAYGLRGPDHGFAGVPDAFERLMTMGCFVPMSTVAIRREAYLGAGGQPEDRHYAEDYALWCRIAASGGRFAFTGAPLAWYRTRSNGRLTRSPHTHLGLVRTLHEAMRENENRLSKGSHAVAYARYCKAVDLLLCHEWAGHGRAQVIRRMAELEPLLPDWLRRKWLLVSHVPAILPRTGRQLLTALRA
jgi:glycosyltransferase involved in cell wall biosynthesis